LLVSFILLQSAVMSSCLLSIIFQGTNICGPADRSVDDLDQSHGAAELLSETYYLVVK